MNENQVPNNVNNAMNQSSTNGINPTVNNTPMSTVTPTVNSTFSTVPPIAEVKVEAASDMTVVNQNVQPSTEVPVTPDFPNGENSGQTSGEPPKHSNVSTVLVILLFLFLFAFIMGMPYISEFMNNLKDDTGLSEIEKEAREEEERQQKEEESKKPTPTPEEDKTTELVCTSASNTVGNYTLVETQKFYYNSKNKILSSKIISNYSFTVSDETYNILIQRCDEDSLKYLTHNGYTMACSYGDSNIEISHEFDLKTFKPIVEGTTNIQANATYQQDLSEIKANLISQGYTCQ